MSPAQLEREVQRLQAQVDRLSAKVPVRRETSSSPSLPTVYEVQDGALISSLDRVGVVRVTATIAVGDLPTVTIPPSVPDGGTYQVPAWPMPSGLPSGLGVGKIVGSSDYGFVLNDSRSGILWDLVLGDRLWTPDSVTLDKVQGLKTARWILNIVKIQL